MTGRWRATVALAGCLLLTGCPMPPTEREREPVPSSPSTAQALPVLPTGASTGLPAYSGPPAGAVSAGPALTLRAAVDLTWATPGVFARAVAAVAAPDGGAHVVLVPADADLDQRLVTVAGPGAGQAILGSVPMPRVAVVWGMHALPDGAVVVTGQLADGGYGFAAVDPASGTSRTSVLVPAQDGTTSADGRSALAGTVLHVFLTAESAAGPVEYLAAVDLASTAAPPVLRNVAADVARASQVPVGRQLGGLVPRPDGGVTLAFDASPTPVVEDRIPTLLAYDAGLRPVGEPVRATDLAEGAEIQAAAGAGDGTVFLLVEVRDASWVLAVPDGGGAGPVLAQLEDRIYDYALVVEPAQTWSLVPSVEGVRAVDLTTGEVRGPLRLECGPNLDVRQVLPATSGAVLLGECDDPREDTQMLWFVGP